MAKLSPLWPKERPHLPLAEVRQWFSAYVYLPKLKDFAVLDGAISEGISTSDPQFGYATAFDAATGKYEGLVYGRLAPPTLAPQGLLVRKEVAETQVRDATRGTDELPVPAVEPGDGTRPPLSSGESDKPKVRRFFGSVEIDAAGRPIKAFEAILNAVVMELQRTQGANVKLTLEISAEAPNGFADSEVSVVRDNAKQLKFNAGSTGFEE